jgi:hypothetical protein
MKKNISKLFVLVIIIGLVVNIGCKKKDEGIDITDGTWAFFLETSDGSNALVYDFRGDQQQGNVYFQNENRGTYTVSGNMANFTVNHYDAESNLYVYTYSGLFSDYYNMSGSFYISMPDGSTINGTFTAER